MNIDSMHETICGVPGVGNFQQVTVTHVMPDVPMLSPVATVQAARDSRNVGMVSMDLRDGGNVSVWPDGTIQVTTDDDSVNYQVSGNVVHLHPVQPQIDRTL